MAIHCTALHKFLVFQQECQKRTGLNDASDGGEGRVGWGVGGGGLQTGQRRGQQSLKTTPIHARVAASL